MVSWYDDNDVDNNDDVNNVIIDKYHIIFFI